MLSDDIPRFIDITIDGADEVEPSLGLIKGGGCGGALLREKIVAQASRRQVIVVDDSKLSPRLGTHRALRWRCWNLAGARRCACSQALARRSRLAGAVAACFGPIKAT
jgi:ribose-5-phosphate isomerase